MKTVSIDVLDTAMNSILSEYGDEVSKILEEEIVETAKEAHKIIKENAPVKRGEYRDSISRKMQKHSQLIYAKSPHDKLTHLLEFGHSINGGTGRTRAFPHWILGENYIIQNFEKKVRERIENGEK